eukprot:tig00000681_g3098.t1
MAELEVPVANRNRSDGGLVGEHVGAGTGSGDEVKPQNVPQPPSEDAGQAAVVTGWARNNREWVLQQLRKRRPGRPFPIGNVRKFLSMMWVKKHARGGEEGNPDPDERLDEMDRKMMVEMFLEKEPFEWMSPASRQKAARPGRRDRRWSRGKARLLIHKEDNYGYPVSKTKPWFRDFIASVLPQSFVEGKVLIMDGASYHDKKANWNGIVGGIPARAAANPNDPAIPELARVLLGRDPRPRLDRHGKQTSPLDYVPPYSPQFNPIERIFGKVKRRISALMRRRRLNVSLAVHDAFSRVTARDVRRSVLASGYYDGPALEILRRWHGGGVSIDDERDLQERIKWRS